MKRLNDIAMQNAKELGYDIVYPAGERDGYHYYRFDYANRPKYLGHPYVIRISSLGDIERVLDLDERYWAIKQTTTPLQSS